jgi:hypothetical protein
MLQLCGVRGGGNAAAQALFWQAKKGHSFVIAFESERERNAAIMLARRFAFDCNVCVPQSSFNIWLNFQLSLTYKVFLQEIPQFQSIKLISVQNACENHMLY